MPLQAWRVVELYGTFIQNWRSHYRLREGSSTVLSCKLQGGDQMSHAVTGIKRDITEAFPGSVRNEL